MRGLTQAGTDQCNQLFFNDCDQTLAKGKAGAPITILPPQTSWSNTAISPLFELFIGSEIDFASYKLQSWLDTGENEYVFIVDQVNTWYILAKKINHTGLAKELIFLGKTQGFYEFMYQGSYLRFDIGHSLSWLLDE